MVARSIGLWAGSLVWALAAFTEPAHGSPLSVATEKFGYPARVLVSSRLKSSGGISYGPENLVDEKPATAWIEGVDGMGAGQTATVRFEKPVLIYGVRFIPGYAKSIRVMERNGVPEFRLRVGEVSYAVGRVILEHRFRTLKSGPLSGEPLRVPTGRSENLLYRYVLLPKPISSDAVSLIIDGALTEAGVAPDNGFSEFHVLTDRSMGSDSVARFLVELREGRAKVPTSLELPEGEEGCPPMLRKRARAAMTGLQVTAVWEDLRRNLEGTAFGDVRRLNPVFTRSSAGVAHLIFDHPAVETCYSDGEGGTQFLPSLRLHAKEAPRLTLESRDWPVP